MSQVPHVPLINPAITPEWMRARATGRGIRVVVIDSGIDARHPDLSGKVKRAAITEQTDNAAYVCREIPVEESRDSFGHGTGVAGVLTKVAPDIELLSIQILNKYNSSSGEALLAAFSWALQQPVRIINLSLTTSSKTIVPELHELCEVAHRQETLVVSSKRNFGEIGCPAKFSSVIGVDNEKLFKHPWQVRFLRNNPVEFAARGTFIKTTAPGGGYQLQTGTSFATPHISGVCALILEIFPDATPWEVKSLLKHLSEQPMPAPQGGTSEMRV